MKINECDFEGKKTDWNGNDIRETVEHKFVYKFGTILYMD